MAPRPSLDRIVDRPDPASWSDDELISLLEAAALFFPSGPLTANALRIAYHRGELAAVEVCGKIFTTPRQILDLATPRPRAAKKARVEGLSGPVKAPGVSLGLSRHIAAARAKRGR